MKSLLVIAALLASTVPAWSTPAEDSPALRGPVPTAPIRDWLADRDEPARTSWTDKAGPVHFALSVSARGGVIECLVERTSGSTELDDTVCRRLRQHANFRPALDKAGKPVLGLYRGDSVGAAAAGAPAMPMVEMVVGLAKMPRGLSDPASVDIAVSVDQIGRVDGCGSGEAQGPAAKILSETACAEAIRSLKPNPARNIQGRAGRSVQSARVLFTADSATFAAAVADPAARLASAAPAGDANEILVVARQITGKREATIPYKGFSPIRDFDTIGYETMLLEAQGGKWYRAKFVAPCIGNSSMMFERGRQPAMAFVTHPDGTFDRFSNVYVRGLPPPFFNGRCEIESLVESAPPKVVKAQMKAERLARTAEAKGR